MTTITEFLTARLDEDEAVAKACVVPAHDGYKPHPELAEWFYEAGGEVKYVQTPEMLSHQYPDPWFVTMDHEGLSSAVDEPEGRHIARHDPARVLAEVEAKRRIVRAVTEGSPVDMWMSDMTLDWVLFQMIQPYAGHPDYDEAWRP